ncbi:MAG: hypothetical protein WD176_03870, partial [Pirellulales bacterium]
MLIIGALVVAALTPKAAVLRNELSKDRVKLLERSEATAPLQLAIGAEKGVGVGSSFPVMRADAAGAPQQVATLVVTAVASDREVSTVRVASEDADFVLSEDDWVLHPLALTAARKIAAQSIGERVSVGFGKACLDVGILIAMAAIIGKCLLDSGAAHRIVLSTQRFIGEERTPVAFAISGFVVAIPVFFDTVFYLLMPLGKAMRLRTGKNYLLYVLSIVVGGTMAHSLVPPTPGPLLVASQLNVNIGLMMIGGLAVGSVTVSAGFLYALWANRRWDIPLRESAELTN